MGALSACRRLAAVSLTVALAGGLAACGDDGGTATTAASSAAAATSAPAASDAATTAAATTAAAAASTEAAPAGRTGAPPLKPGGDGCDHAAPPAPSSKQYEQPPASPLAAGEDATLVVYTSCGPIRVFLDRDRGGAVTDAVAGLAADGFYDGLTFHRVVPGYVAQGGDPNGRGDGGPGFDVVQAPPADYVYQQGDVAMAKRGDEAPGTAGSQFFVLLTTDGAAGLTQLGPPAGYAVIGHAQDPASLKTLARIDALGVGDGPPVEPVYIWWTELVPEA